MNVAIQHLRALAAGVDLVHACAGLTLEQLAEEGPVSAARDLYALYVIYFGETKYTRKQAQALAGARARGHSLPALLRIERYARRMKTQRDGWDLRVRLCAAEEGDIGKIGKKALDDARPEPVPSVKIFQGAKFSKLILTAPASIVEDIRPNIDPADPVGSLHAAFTGGGIQRPVVQTLGVMELPDFVEVTKAATGDLSGTGSDNSASPDGGKDCHDIIVRLSNGSSISGAELVQRQLADAGLVMLVSPVHGPVNLYRTQRLANDKQRTMAKAEHPTCAWPGCRTGSDRAQIHHMHEWRDGGETNAVNLVPLCPYHNGVNGQPGRGRMIRINGQVKWIPPS